MVTVISVPKAILSVSDVSSLLGCSNYPIYKLIRQLIKVEKNTVLCTVFLHVIYSGRAKLRDNGLISRLNSLLV